MWWWLPFLSFADTPSPPAAWSDRTTVPLHEAFPPPEGFDRVQRNLFGEWLGELPVRPEGIAVKTWDGRTVHHDARVIAMPVVRGDLQQCADSAIRLRAEYQLQTGQPVSFHATSGDEISYQRWMTGQRPTARGSTLTWTPGGDRTWEGYLRAVFAYAGTASLEAHETVAITEPRAGDLLVEGGFPGHAVVILDVARRGNQTRILIGEGFMPAQDFHVELGPDDGWWPWKPGLDLPHWPLGPQHLRRWAP